MILYKVMELKASPKTVMFKSTNVEVAHEKIEIHRNTIVSILSQQEKGMKVSDICLEYGISQATFYQWQRKYGSMGVNDLKKLKEMESDLAQFKRIVADLTLQNRVLKDVIEKKL